MKIERSHWSEECNQQQNVCRLHYSITLCRLQIVSGVKLTECENGKQWFWGGRFQESSNYMLMCVVSSVYQLAISHQNSSIFTAYFMKGNLLICFAPYQMDTLTNRWQTRLKTSEPSGWDYPYIHLVSQLLITYMICYLLSNKCLPLSASFHWTSNTSPHTPPQGHICTARHCCCCRLVFSRCVRCFLPEGRGGTAARRRPRGARRTGSPPGRSENETSPWKTVEWSGPPSRHSSDGERTKREDKDNFSWSPVCQSVMTTLQKKDADDYPSGTVIAG